MLSWAHLDKDANGNTARHLPIFYIHLLFLFPANQACNSERSFQEPRVGVSNRKMAIHVRAQFYVDKELVQNLHSKTIS